MREQQNTLTQTSILEGIKDGADYIINVLLDDEGKSRCDYNIMEGKWYPYEVPWHTGQLINALVEVYKLTNDHQYLSAAKKAGDWWLGLEIKDKPRLYGMVNSIHGDGVDKIVCATTTDGTPGLFNLYRVTGDKKYAALPTSAGEWMLQHLYIPEKGMLYDMVDPVSGEVMKEASLFWPEKKSQDLNDVARPNNEGFLYKEMYEYTNNEKYKEVFLNLCDSLVEKQGPEGIWMQFTPNKMAQGSFHPRFNLWNAESLIEGYQLTGNRKYLDAALKTLVFHAKYQQKDGTFFYENFLDGTARKDSLTGSAVSFGGLLWLRLYQLGVGDEFKERIDLSALWIMVNRFPADHPDKNLAGAFLDLRTRVKKNKLWMTQRDIGVAFALRFFTAYYGFRFS